LPFDSVYFGPKVDIVEGGVLLAGLNHEKGAREEKLCHTFRQLEKENIHNRKCICLI